MYEATQSKTEVHQNSENDTILSLIVGFLRLGVSRWLWCGHRGGDHAPLHQKRECLMRQMFIKSSVLIFEVFCLSLTL